MIEYLANKTLAVASEHKGISLLLPTKPLIITLRYSEGKNIDFILSKNCIGKLDKKMEKEDVVIDGAEELVSDLLRGKLLLSTCINKGLKYKGAYRHLLLLESIFWLCKWQENHV